MEIVKAPEVEIPALRTHVPVDRFTIELNNRLPTELKGTFTPEQVEAMKVLFGTRSWQRHSCDVRKRFRLRKKTYYLILIMGNTDSDDRRSRLDTLLTILVGTAMFTVGTLFVMFLLYLLKSALNINILPDFSFGLWDWFKAVFPM